MIYYNNFSEHGGTLEVTVTETTNAASTPFHDVPGNRSKDFDGVLAVARDLGIRRQGRWLIEGVDVSVHRGEIVTLIGPNGSGKTTTAKAILGLLVPDRGSVARPGNPRIGYVPQRLSIDPALPLDVTRLMTLTGNFPRSDIADTLERVGIGHLARASVQALSGGEFQRALLARALIRRPELLVLDEPVQGVDVNGEVALYELIRDIRADLGCGILLISHDLHIVMAETDTVVCMNGHVCCSGTPDSVAANVEYRRLFGRRAADALAIYRHRHDHAHHHDGTVVDLDHSRAGGIPAHADGAHQPHAPRHVDD